MTYQWCCVGNDDAQQHIVVLGLQYEKDKRHDIERDETLKEQADAYLVLITVVEIMDDANERYHRDEHDVYPDGCRYGLIGAVEGKGDE